jgi:hypothetical protein
MTGRRYYITSLADWQRHATRFTNSHWLALDDNAVLAVVADAAGAGAEAPDVPTVGARHAVPELVGSTVSPSSRELNDATRIVVLIEADEGAHLALEDDPTFEPLPHPLASKPISEAAQSALAQHGVRPGATTFDATEAVARAHPLLRHRVF